MNTQTLLLLVLIACAVGALPLWPYSRSWGYRPMGILSLLLVVFLVWAIAGERPLFRSSGGNIERTLQDAGRDIKSTGRDVADSLRDAVN